MADLVVKFCCSNCRKINRINKSQIDEAIQIGNTPVGVCGHCGLVNGFKDPRLAAHADVKPLICVPFVDKWPEHLPSGELPGGMFADAHGRALSEVDFMAEFGMNPRINLAYRRAGSPPPKDKC
ncbi:MAG TPA: hypothetical protein PKV33_07800 [Methanothrix sp.]|jgi:hypothetical protein|nr:hypothetical protein [Methanothrix sp.]